MRPAVDPSPLKARRSYMGPGEHLLNSITWQAVTGYWREIVVYARVGRAVWCAMRSCALHRIGVQYRLLTALGHSIRRANPGKRLIETL